MITQPIKLKLMSNFVIELYLAFESQLEVC